MTKSERQIVSEPDIFKLISADGSMAQGRAVRTIARRPILTAASRFLVPHRGPAAKIKLKVCGRVHCPFICLSPAWRIPCCVVKTFGTNEQNAWQCSTLHAVSPPAWASMLGDAAQNVCSVASECANDQYELVIFKKHTRHCCVTRSTLSSSTQSCPSSSGGWYNVLHGGTGRARGLPSDLGPKSPTATLFLVYTTSTRDRNSRMLPRRPSNGGPEMLEVRLKCGSVGG
ncbi:hypothetical protein C8Q80DRAFT_826034 [Daedaleopsis nitida]|nr:hypothetical protein C8Q80DRAFT_826034 [Daedaleopsis nitida]